MKNKKGFTLIELLLTGTLVAIISIIVVPNIISTYKKSKENEYKRFLNDLFLSTEAYIQKHSDEYEELKNVSGKAYVYVDQLLNSRYLKSTLYDTKNNKKIKEETDFTVEVTKKEDGTYAYKLYEERIVPEVCEYNIGNEWTFDYTGNEQEFIVPCSGKYKLETWGAQGGSGIYNSKGSDGGYGAYATGEIYLSNDILYINVGGHGIANKLIDGIELGGYNGGGNSVGSDAFRLGGEQSYGSGGGATHIAKITGLLKELENNKDDIIMVSGGGGGSTWYYVNARNTFYGTGGDAGGIEGNASSNNYNREGNNQISLGGAQNKSALTGSNDIYGGFGYGGSGTYFNYSSNTSYTIAGSGAGAGWYGGNANRNITGSGGGSSYIGNALLSNKVMYCYNCKESSELNTKTISTTNVSLSPISNYAKQGNGYAKITYLGNQ